jgi:hypothetical protein
MERDCLESDCRSSATVSEALLGLARGSWFSFGSKKVAVTKQIKKVP